MAKNPDDAQKKVSSKPEELSRAKDGSSRGSAAPAHLVDVSNLDAVAASTIVPPTEDQIFYLRVLARHLCSRKGIKTLTLAQSAEVQGDHDQQQNKAQAFLNRYTKGPDAFPDYRAFRNGIAKLRDDYARQGVDLFDDPIMRQALAVVYPHDRPVDPNDDTFLDGPLSRWFAINGQRSRDVCRDYGGFWWIVRPSSTKSQSQPEPEFNVSLLNIVPEKVSDTGLPLFIFHQPTGDGRTSRGISSRGRVLALDSDQVLLKGKRRGGQAPTQLSWKYVWDPEHLVHESIINGTIFTVNTYGQLIQSYFYGCYIEGTDTSDADEFEPINRFLRRFLGVKTEAEIDDVPTSLEESRLLMPLQKDADGPPVGLAALTGQPPSHRPIVSASGLQRLKTAPQDGPILTIG